MRHSNSFRPKHDFNSGWTAEEAWANGYNEDGTVRQDVDWLVGLVQFNPAWSPEEAWANGCVSRLYVTIDFLM